MAQKTRPQRNGLHVVPPSPGADLPEPPAHLSAETRAWWVSVVRDYALADHHLKLLQAAAEAWDRCQQARAALAEHGLTHEDDRGRVLARPEIAIERDSRMSFMRALRELDLDIAPPPQPRGRPPGLRSNRR